MKTLVPELCGKPNEYVWAYTRNGKDVEYSEFRSVAKRLKLKNSITKLVIRPKN